MLDLIACDQISSGAAPKVYGDISDLEMIK